MTKPVSFEVRTLKDDRWMIEVRTSNQGEAITQARELVGSREFDSVHVAAETYDEESGTFREKVIFKHSKIR
ncbi:MAG: hypothetical protein EXQ89_04355 [Rhodospirillaceae bacterium]|nr:hypothetical protein [Rhodospirillaceae bacterium]